MADIDPEHVARIRAIFSDRRAYSAHIEKDMAENVRPHRGTPQMREALEGYHARRSAEHDMISPVMVDHTGLATAEHEGPYGD